MLFRFLTFHIFYRFSSQLFTLHFSSLYMLLVLSQIRVYTNNGYVGIDAIQLVSTPASARVCNTCRPTKYQVIRNPKFSRPVYTSNTMFTDRYELNIFDVPISTEFVRSKINYSHTWHVNFRTVNCWGYSFVSLYCNTNHWILLFHFNLHKM